MNWQFATIWNESLEKGRPERLLEVRDHIWAGEIGGAYIDRYLKMKAVTPTNPPNPRSMRKFEAGNMIEWIVELVLRRAGILIDSQEWLEYQYPDLLRVTGKLDFLAGGEPDWEKAKAEVHALKLPDFFNRGTAAIIAHFQTKYPTGLDKIVIEVKSCSLFMFERYEKVGANNNHVLQLFHYLKAKNLPEGHIVYVCKDDLRMLEFEVKNPDPKVEAIYKDDIEKMTAFINNNEQPPLEKELLFDEEVGRFSQNYKVGYSNYLTKLYGYKDQFEYDTKYKGMVSSWNRTFKRCVAGDNMTKLNLEVIEGIKRTFPDFEAMVEYDKAKGISLEDEESLTNTDNNGIIQ